MVKYKYHVFARKWLNKLQLHLKPLITFKKILKIHFQMKDLSKNYKF